MGSSRERNPRGTGGRLREEIVASAFALLEQGGTEDAITLRAVARGAGITAPSIYAHFADRDAIVEAVVIEAFGQLSTALHEATDDVADPVARVNAGCRAYLRFASERPHRYRLLFGRPWNEPGDAGTPLTREEFEALPGTDTFGILVSCVSDCVAAGRSTSTDPFADAAALWSGLHGYSTLHTSLPNFPWPAADATINDIITRLARLT
jgi:AcrR family transcriptional regulator